MRFWSYALLASAIAVGSTTARADGFALNRYEPNAAGSWFFMVNHPWYSNTRYLAADFTLDYAHNELRSGVFNAKGNFDSQGAVVKHMVAGHFSVAGALFGRLQINVSVPVTFAERGTAAYGVAPLSGAAVGDPRLGAIVRLYGDPDNSPVSVHLGGALWIPIEADAKHQGDRALRGRPNLIVAGRALEHLRYVVDLGFLLRPKAVLGDGIGNATGSEMQIQAGLAYADVKRAFQIGPEAQLGTTLTGGHAFKKYYTSFDFLVGAQYTIKRLIQVGAAIGGGALPQYGEPDVRFLFRLAYAPLPAQDADNDGVPDSEDSCPKTAGPRGAKGCPDADNDGVPDAVDACPSDAGKLTKVSRTNGCPDADDDGIPDAEDKCPNQKPGAHPDQAVAGCPVADADDDGVPDAQDECPGEGVAGNPDPHHPGCPFKDRDKDGYSDKDDQCPDTPPGKYPDPARLGCPLPDADGDGIPDAMDKCPDKPGGAATETNEYGCPKITIQTGSVTELKMVNFETNKAVLLPESFPVLDEVAKLLILRTEFKRIVVEGHADDTGTTERNQKLSEDRARTVMNYLVKRGVGKARLSFIGYGDTRPLVNERTDEARAKNRRVEMRVTAK